MRLSLLVAVLVALAAVASPVFEPQGARAESDQLFAANCPSGAASNLTVPSNVTRVRVTLVGASGEPQTRQIGPRGSGGSITGTFSVTAGEVVTVLLGCAGTNGAGGANGGAAGGAGGIPGGGGGGSSRVFSSLHGMLLTAGGGGGGGGYSGLDGPNALGAAGGGHQAATGAGLPGAGSPDGIGGRGAPPGTGGTGGTAPGGQGFSNGSGGAGGSSAGSGSGGGGGAGCAGGGGGGAGLLFQGGGGGGGGSSCAGTGASDVSFGTPTGSLNGTARVELFERPTVTIGFSPSTVHPGEPALMNMIIQNGNPFALTNLSLADNLGSPGLAVADPPSLSTSCGGSLTGVTAGSTNVSLTGATLAAGAGCLISFNVSSRSSGAKSNFVTGSSSETGPWQAFSGTLQVIPHTVSVFSKRFATGAVNAGYSVRLFFGFTPGTQALTGVSFTDRLPAGLLIDTPNGLAMACDGKLSAPAGTSTISFTDGELRPGEPCTFSLSIRAVTPGAWMNTTSTVTTTQGVTLGSSQAQLIVTRPPAGQLAFSPPVLQQRFGPSSLSQPGETTLQLNLSNPNPIPLTGVGFVNPFPAGLRPVGMSIAPSCRMRVVAGGETDALFGGDVFSAITSALASLGNSLVGDTGPGQSLTQQAFLDRSLETREGGLLVGRYGLAAAGVTLNPNEQCTVMLRMRAEKSLTNVISPVVSNEGGSGPVQNASLTVVPAVVQKLQFILALLGSFNKKP